MTIDQVLEDLRLSFWNSSLTKRELAALAGLHPNTLCGMESPSWSPNVDTLRRLENVLLSPKG